jgi:hypothetical protein
MIDLSAGTNKGNTMEFPKVGDIITLTIDVEIEEDDTILRYPAGEEIKVIGFDDLQPGQSLEDYFKEWEAIELHVELGDIHVQNMWDRSGQSDYEVSGKETYLSLDEDAGLKIIRHED